MKKTCGLTVKPVHRLYIKTITRENCVSVPAEAHVAAR